MALQMNWQPTLQKRKPTNHPPLALKNLGNTCYLNSVLQCLTYTPPLANFCLKNQHTSLCLNQNPNSCPFCILESRINRSLNIQTPLDAPNRIRNCLTVFAQHFRYGRQEDAHEFLRYVIDACHDACLRLKKLKELPNGSGNGGGGDNSVVKEIFGGALRSQVKCVSCGGESNKTDEIMDISLDLFTAASLKDALQRFFQIEILDGNNKYKCDKCNKLVVAKKQMSILKAPNILVIQLKRFEGLPGGKIDRAIAFEEVLLLSSYMCKESQDPKPEYKLFGVIVHSGFSPESGHYYAYIKDAMGRWYCCNDSHVSISNLQEVLSEKVYILFFSRIDQRSRPSKPTSSANGVKSFYSNGNGASPMAEAALLSKSVVTRPYEAQKAEDNSILSKNGKVHSALPIKFALSKTLDSRKVCGNGNALTNGLVKKHIDTKESSETNKMRNKASVTQSIVANGDGSYEAVENGIKQKLPLSHENGELQSTTNNPIIKEVSEDNGPGHSPLDRGSGSNLVSHDEGEKRPITMSGHKRKSLDQELHKSLLQNEARATVEKLRETITEDALSRLRSCGWYDEVCNFMRAEKKLCAQAMGNGASTIELKKILIEQAKTKLLSQVPASLKQNLVKTFEASVK